MEHSLSKPIFSFPNWERSKSIVLWGSLASIVFVGVYGWCNKMASQSIKHYVMFTDWELSIPLVPWMIFPYISLNLMFLASAFVLKDTSSIKGFCLSIVYGALIAGFFFYFFPGKLGFERINVTDFSPIFDFMFSIDHPHNLFPSLHITYSTLGALSMREQTLNKKFHLILYVWLIFIYASVVLVHQHHLFDILTGFILAAALYRYVYLRSLPFRRSL